MAELCSGQLLHPASIIRAPHVLPVSHMMCVSQTGLEEVGAPPDSSVKASGVSVPEQVL